MKILEKEYERNVKDTRKEIDYKFMAIFERCREIYSCEILEYRIDRLRGYLKCACDMNAITFEEHDFLSKVMINIEIELKKREIEKLEGLYWIL